MGFIFSPEGGSGPEAHSGKEWPLQSGLGAGAGVSVEEWEAKSIGEIWLRCFQRGWG